jgi:hypothetical protein
MKRKGFKGTSTKGLAGSTTPPSPEIFDSLSVEAWCLELQKQFAREMFLRYSIDALAKLPLIYGDHD